MACGVCRRLPRSAVRRNSGSRSGRRSTATVLPAPRGQQYSRSHRCQEATKIVEATIKQPPMQQQKAHQQEATNEIEATSTIMSLTQQKPAMSRSHQKLQKPPLPNKPPTQLQLPEPRRHEMQYKPPLPRNHQRNISHHHQEAINTIADASTMKPLIQQQMPA